MQSDWSDKLNGSTIIEHKLRANCAIRARYGKETRSLDANLRETSFDLILRDSSIPLICISRSITNLSATFARLPITIANGTIRTRVTIGEKEEDVVHSAVIQQDVQATIETERFVLLEDNLFIGPIFTQKRQEAIERKKTFISKDYLEKQWPGFIGPINVHYYKQRCWAYKLCDLILIDPLSDEWIEASNTTRSLWEDWWEECETLIKQLKQLPLNYLQVAVIRELESKLKESFDFFINRKITEATEAQVSSRTRSGNKC